MKKLLLILLSTILIFNGILGCSKLQEEISIYLPDGAPAIALTPAMNKGFEKVKFNVVDGQTIGSFVTGKELKADICALPINMASNLLGSGDNYKLLGTITHGNFYLLSKKDITITTDNLQDLIGLKIGVLQLKNIPGLTFKSVLLENKINYAEITSPDTAKDNQVNLIGISGTEIGSDNYDAFLVPSPQADLKAKALNLNFIASLQELYGENGFPQAVIAAKKSLIDNNAKFISEFKTSLLDSDNFISEANIESICSLILSSLQDGLTPTFTAKNLTYQMIENSSIKFVESKDCKEEIINFISRIQKVDGNAVKTFNDKFFL